MTLFWFLLSTIFILLELINPGLFFFLALSLGALITMLMQFQEALFIHEYAFFFISSGIMFVLLNILVKIILKKKQSKIYDSNIHLLIGKTIEITEIISDETGYTQVDGEIWMIKVHNNQKLQVGMHALVIGVKGCHLQVTLLKETL
jgi:membrane protein implicated in regulation of membrane protease activity